MEAFANSPNTICRLEPCLDLSEVNMAQILHGCCGQSGDDWGGRDNLYFSTGRGGGMVHLIFINWGGRCPSPVSFLVHSLLLT